MAVLSLDLGGSHIGCAVVAGDRVLSKSSTVTSADSLAHNLAAVTRLLKSAVQSSTLALSEIKGLAIGFCGIVDGATGRILSTLNKYPDAQSIDLQAWGQREFDLPVLIENDACMALLGEAYAGAAKGAQDVVMITLGTGIGGAAMLGGRILRSRAGQAGCLGGHLPVNLNGRRCTCGAVGCAEAEASTVVLPLLCREHPGFSTSSLRGEMILNFATVYRASDAGDLVASDVIAHCERVWSVLTVGLIHAYGPELVLFGGGVMQRGDRVLTSIRRYVECHMWRTTEGVPRLEVAALGSDAGFFGGAALFAMDAAHTGEAPHGI